MGVRWNPCVHCAYVVPDCGDVRRCSGCEKFICDECYPKVQRGDATYVCTFCWDDEPTIADRLKMLRYVLEKHELKASDIRTEMRQKRLLYGKRRIVPDNEADDEPCKKLRRREATVPQITATFPERNDKCDDVYASERKEFDRQFDDDEEEDDVSDVKESVHEP